MNKICLYMSINFIIIINNQYNIAKTYNQTITSDFLILPVPSTLLLLLL